ncbi:hypothetical protein JHK85_024077 [Glycine max]|nr:hypothetical protein JHK85_024077 [Glycine max]
MFAGVWFMHCHLEVHTSWGLKMAWFVLDGKLPNQKLFPPPTDLPKTFVGEKNRGPTNAEKAIGYEHGVVVPKVPILGYVLGTDDDGVGVGVSLKDVFCEVNGDDAPALQPMPPRLKLLALPRSLYLLTIMEEKEGVGLKRL